MKLGTYKKQNRLRRVLRTVRTQIAVGTVAVLLALVGVFFVIRSQTVSAVCECNLFSTPTGQSTFQEGTPLELGVKFIPSVDGRITGVRFYKQGAMSGTHTGRLWSVGGTPLKNAVFQSETASGWQTVTFDSPVSVTANTTYIASVTMADSRYISTANYFTSNIVNGPLTAPSSTSSGGNGVFNGTGGTFPDNTSNSSNYWIDVSFYATDPPTVSSVAPTNGTTNFEPGDTVSATFDMGMDAASFTSSGFTVKDSDSNAVAGSYSYDGTSKTASFIATNGFDTSKTYTATLKGGTGTTVKNAAGIALAADYSWSFSTSSTNLCPCSLKDHVAPDGAGSFDESGAAELGVKVRPSTNGYITSLRFYKPLTSTETTHTGNIWSSTGTKLATVTFTNESDYGWQEAKLSSPLRVNADQTYVLSYGTTTAVYTATGGALTGTTFGSGYLKAYADQASENTATGSGTRNGVFVSTANSYPNVGSTNGTYYWIDADFSVSSSPDMPLEVGVTQPKSSAVGVKRDQVVTAKFNRPLDGATVTNSTFRLFDKDNVQVSGTGTWDTAKGVATFTPSTQLGAGQRYTAKLAGTVADPGGTTLGSEYTWSFTTGSPVTTDPNAAPGGPILVITDSSTSSKYYTEILRTEGMNYYASKDISQVDAATLAAYKVVVMAEMTLSQPQADMLGTWVNGGGNLIAMRPDAKLAGLLGLTAAGTTRSNQYMLINTASAPGTGLVNETIQFKGTADNYSLNGASAIASFYSDAATATSNPAVTTKSVGAKGGTAVAFAYDLAKSVIRMHQGNQAWAGQSRDGDGAARANDLFFGNMSGDSQPDWVDLNKFHIPQADEQQRLLANVIIESAKDKQPMPRFWYMPGSYKTALVMAGDDHGLDNATGTEITLTNFLNNSRTDCSVLDWECDRASHYVYENSALTNSRASQFVGYKFEIGDHVGTSCNAFASYAALSTEYTTNLGTWRAKYTAVPNQLSHRYHCYIWSDWDSQARVDVAQGIRYDLNYVAFPSTWVGSRAPIMTGSAMNMRFTDASGAMLDVRQGVTNLDDQATTNTNAAALLDNAIGSAGYYGIYGTHYDMSNSFDKTLIAAAKTRNVPMISSLQALTWLDGRNSSTFSSFGGSAGRFTFTVAAAEGAVGLRAMLPIADAGGTLQTLALDSANVSYQTQTIKGEQYAVFDGQPGEYTATYTDYDPNAGGDDGGGDTGGGDSGSGSSGSGSSTTTGGQSSGATAVPPRRIAQATDEQNVLSDDSQQPAVEEQTGTDDSPSFNTPSTTPDTSSDEPARDIGFWPWLLGGLAFGAVLIGLWWFFIWRRRHADNSGSF